MAELALHVDRALVLLWEISADPSEDIWNSRRIEAVYLGGKRVEAPKPPRLSCALRPFGLTARLRLKMIYVARGDHEEEERDEEHHH